MTFPPDFDALLRAVLAVPDDPLPCLFLADWCQERGLDGAGRMLRQPKPRLPVDGWTLRACRALAGLGLMSRFVRDVCVGVEAYEEGRGPVRNWQPGDGPAHGRLTMVVARKDRLSPKQYLWVWRLVLKYRRQIEDQELLDRAADLLPAGVVEAP